jgi:hypothetical protein
MKQWPKSLPETAIESRMTKLAEAIGPIAGWPPKAFQKWFA